MKVCSNNHQPICFTPVNAGGFLYSGCPLCAAAKEIDGYQREIETYRKNEGIAIDHETKKLIFDGIQPS
jgi:hypothetical protein